MFRFMFMFRYIQNGQQAKQVGDTLAQLESCLHLGDFSLIYIYGFSEISILFIIN